MSRPQSKDDPRVGDVWADKRHPSRRVTLTYVEEGYVWPIRNSSRRRQRISVVTLWRDYRLVARDVPLPGDRQRG